MSGSSGLELDPWKWQPDSIKFRSSSLSQKASHQPSASISPLPTQAQLDPHACVHANTHTHPSRALPRCPAGPGEAVTLEASDQPPPSRQSWTIWDSWSPHGSLSALRVRDAWTPYIRDALCCPRAWPGGLSEQPLASEPAPHVGLLGSGPLSRPLAERRAPGPSINLLGLGEPVLL